MSMKNIGKFIAAAVISANAIMAAVAQQADVPISDSDPVLVFNRVCYAQVPVIDNIREMSTRFAWERMGGEDLKQFTTVENPSVLEGWDVRLAQRLYRLGVVQSSLTENFKQTFPEFAEGVATGCTLILDGSDDADIILERMISLAGKQPTSSDVQDGDLSTTTWAGGNEDFKVFLFYKSDQKGKANLLNVTILSKETT
ncbi:MAG: hypothetical protein ACR2O3_00135 [Rhizobiaceae bacterium]